MEPQLVDWREKKTEIRKQAHERRNAQPEKDELSLLIGKKFMSLPEYQSARTVLFYLDARSEVRTRHTLPEALASGKRIAVPYCVDGYLRLFHLSNMEELSVGMYKILEPLPELRDAPEKLVAPESIDLVMVPGVAFDRRGARMGHGFGYYDKLLEQVPHKTPLVALAFDCQLFPEIPVQPHDVFMDKILTESETILGQGRGAENA